MPAIVTSCKRPSTSPYLSRLGAVLLYVILVLATPHELPAFQTTQSDAQKQVEQERSSVEAEAGIEVQNAILKTIESTDVATEVPGVIDQLEVSEGDTVAVGQLLGSIRDKVACLRATNAKIEMGLARKKARSDIDIRLAQRRLEVAENELERAEDANSRIPNTYPPKEIDRLRLVEATAKLERERANHDREIDELEVMLAENRYQQSQEMLTKHQVLSPVTGVVVALNKREGEWVEPGTELLRIVKIDRLRIEGFVRTEQLSEVLDGRPARVTVLRGDRNYEVQGRVVFASFDANPVSGLVRVYLEIDNPDLIFRPGMRVQVVIEESTK